MAKSTSTALGEHFSDFVARQVKEGRYDNEDDVLRAGLRLLEEREMKVERLRAALKEGEESGEPEPFDIESFLSEVKTERARQG
jgi:antitoxin ParD1/3/4